jgi:carboxyl-terminal processing protease
VQEDAVTRQGKRPASKKLIKIVAVSLSVVLVFLLGVGVGNGNIIVSSASNSSNKSLPEDLSYTSVEELYDLLKANYDGKLDAQTLQDGMRAGLISAAGDPYTQYFTAEEAKEFNQELSGSFIGIGAELGENADGDLIIATPIKGFPAEKAGLRPQDVIVSINGKSTADTTIADAVKQIRGEKGTDVKLRILRNKTEDLSITITREEIKIPSVKWEVSEDKIGYMQITQFSPDTSMLASKAAREFADKNVKGVVLDMRGNPGGLLDSAVEVASLWVPSGKTILAQKQGGVTVQTYTASGETTLGGIPTAVLIDAGSASASEIVAGALKDNKVATLYGEKSYGKGSVQEIHNLPNGEEVKITIARWYRPNGQNIDKKGIKPDKEVKLSDDDYKEKRDPQKDAAYEFVRSR